MPSAPAHYAKQGLSKLEMVTAQCAKAGVAQAWVWKGGAAKHAQQGLSRPSLNGDGTACKAGLQEAWLKKMVQHSRG